MGKEKDKLIRDLKDFKKRTQEIAKIDKIYLFGSRAKDTWRDNSDVDLLVISDDFKGKRFFKRSPKFYLIWDYPYDVDIICLTNEEVNIKKRQLGVIKEAMDQAIEI